MIPVRQKGQLGKYNAGYRTRDIYVEYKSIAKHPVSEKIFNTLVREIINKSMLAVIEEGKIFKIPNIGKMRIKTMKPKLLNDDNTLNKKELFPDWGKTWKSWGEEYPGLTREEIKVIPNKRVIYIENDHSNGYRYKFVWEVKDASSARLRYFKVIPVTSNKKRLAKVARENPDICYYD